jgi:hypothetical protein
MLLTALIAMLVATLAHHLGLSEAVAKVISKILKCPRCLTFWFVLFVLFACGCNILIAIGLSLLMAYCSIWTELLLDALNRLYERIWQGRRK